MDRKELIEKARELLACGALSKEAADAIKGDLPELKESEDERMIGVLKRIVERYAEGYDMVEAGVPKAGVLAWLEKQKPVAHENDFVSKEQKPVEWDEYTETNLDRALMIIKKAKGNLQGYQSDDGIYECDMAIECIEHILYRGINIDGLCKPAEWSEEDKKMLNAIIDDIHCGTDFNAEVMHEANEREKWLRERFKSLRPHPSWKPSEEQMEILQYVCEESSHPNQDVIPTLQSLYNDLKKL